MTAPDQAPLPLSPPPTGTASGTVPPLPRAYVKRKAPYALWLVWLIPIIAVLTGLWLGAKSFLDRGPTITISFRSAEGLEAGKTKIKYKDVDIGLVKSIRLSSDHKTVEVAAELKKGDSIESLLVSDTRFWVVRPQISAGGVSGLGTLLSGAHIGVDIGRDTEAKRNFVGLEVPPIVSSDNPGRHFVLQSKNMGSLNVGSPLYLRRVQVGQVVAYDLDATGKQVTFTVFVNSPYHRFVTPQSRFWHASGIDLSLNADGLRFNTESLVSVLSGGGIAFEDMGDERGIPSKEAVERAEFVLHEDRVHALKQPDAYGYNYQLLFASSVRGLNVGAPVDFRGLPIGEVTAIQVDGLPSPKNPNPRVSVSIRIYPSRLPTRGATPPPTAGAEGSERGILDPMVAKGFRAQLRNGNLLTGQLYVTLDFFERAAAARIDWSRKPALFPTIAGSLDSMQDTIASIADKVERLPLDGLVKDLRDTIKSINQTVQSTDAVVQQMGQQVTPEARKLLEDARQSLGVLNNTLNTVNQTVSPDAPLPAQASNALAEMTQAAKSLRALADYLERHPESLVRGKPEDAK